MREDNFLYQCVYNKLQKYEQLHLLQWYSSLNDYEKNEFLLYLNKIDYLSIEQVMNEEKIKKADDDIEPIDVFNLKDSELIEKKLHLYGMEEIKKGHVAVVLLAGGQATRLGLNKPKGTLDIGITKPLYLFEIVIEKLKRNVEETGCYIDLYIMVSETNEDDIKSFFMQHNFFGYRKKSIIFFRQKMYPKFFFDGKIALEEKGQVAKAPGGNGVWFDVLRQNNYIEKMRNDNIKWINLLSIDNPLYSIIDTKFLGALIMSGRQMAVQVVEKNNPYEKVGVICKKKGKPYVKEYYEMSYKEKEAFDEQHRLRYRYGVALNYMFKLNELEMLQDILLPVHLVEKKVPFIDCMGKKVIPNEENGYVMEKLALDMIQLFEHVLVYEIDRKKNFAPIKNRNGEDSIDTARELLKLNGYKL